MAEACTEPASSCTPTALWLVPSPDHESALRTIVAELAERYETPLFEPHVTLYVGTMASGVEPVAALASAAEAADVEPPLELSVEGIRSTELWNKTLFIELESSRSLTAISQAAQRALQSPNRYPLEPHLSLSYFEGMTAADRQHFIASLSPPASRLRFSSLALVQPGPGGWKDAGGMRPISRRSLELRPTRVAR